MAGKILKVSANDVYGEVDERVVVVFACFEHTKYMNNYVIFSFLGEYEKKMLCYGSVHIKEDSLVIFSVRDNIKTYIECFVDEYIMDAISKLEEGDFHAAVFKAQYVTSNYPKYYLGHYLLGVAMAGMEQYDDAVHSFETALK